MWEISFFIAWIAASGSGDVDDDDHHDGNDDHDDHHDDDTF